jgi:hypothetical protein
VYLGLVGHKQESQVVDIDVEGVAVVVVVVGVGDSIVVVVGDTVVVVVGDIVVVVVVVVEIVGDTVVVVEIVGDTVVLVEIVDDVEVDVVDDVVVGSLGEGIVVGNIVVGGDDIALLMVEVTLLLNIVGFLLNVGVVGVVGNIDRNNLVEHLFLGAVNHPFQYCFDCFDLGNPYCYFDGFWGNFGITNSEERRKALMR